MVFLHNGGSDHQIWHYQLPVFSQWYTTYALDLLGFGQSDKPDIEYDLELYRGLLKSFVESMGLTEPVLVGNCIGAAAALEYALLYPEGVKALILFNVCGGRIMLKKTTGLGLEAGPSMKEHYLTLFRSVGKIPWLHRYVVNQLFGPPPKDNPVFEHLRDLQHTAEHANSRWNLMRGLDTFNKFSRDFDKPDGFPPTYLLWGEENRVLSATCGLELAVVLRPDRLSRLRGAGHMAMNEKPALVNLLVQQFLEELEEAA